MAFDLDDTLFKEMDYVRSAYRAIAGRYGLHLLPAMMAAPSPREAFDSTGLPIRDILEIYRCHETTIRLPWQSVYALASLRARGVEMALVTDGRANTQRAKIDALGLTRYIPAENIYISEEVGSEKVSGEAFRRIMVRTGVQRYVYVGDNPAKDFVAARREGWMSVCLLDDGQNISGQDFLKYPRENRPDLTIKYMTELVKIVTNL